MIAHTRRVIAAFVLLAVSACSSGGTVSPPHLSNPGPPPSGGNVQAGTVSLPSGSTLSLSSLTVSTSAGSAAVSSAGAFSVPIYSGPQFTMVSDAAGDPMLAAFLGPSAQTIDATSTAKLLAFFACGFYMLPSPYRAQMVDAIATVPAFSPVVSAVTSGLQSSTPLSSNAALATALGNLVTSLYGSSSAAHARLAAVLQSGGIRRPADVLINPSNAQSGITAIGDFPNGFHLMNTYRRSAVAFVDRDSHVDASGKRIPDAAQDVVPPIQVPAVSGLSTIGSSLVSAVQGYYTGATAYTPTYTASTPLSNESGAKSTRYIITVVGAGKTAAFSLRPEEATAQHQMVVQQLVQDIVLPLISAIVIPLSGGAIDTALAYDGGNNLLNDLISTLTTAAPQIYDMMNNGQVGDALTLAYNTIITSNSLQGYVFQFIQNQFQNFSGSDDAQAFFKKGSAMLNKLNILSGLLVSADFAVIAVNVRASNGADQFVIDVIGDKVVLSPSSATVQNNGTQTFTVTVPSSSGSGETVVYHWSNTANFGHLTDGKSGHTDNFDSSSNTATYTANATGTGTDTITATAYLVQGQSRLQIGDPQTATVNVTTVTKTNVTVSPRQNNTGWGGSVTLNGSFTPSTSQPVTYHWYVLSDPLAGGNGTTPGDGTISDPVTGKSGKDFTTTSSSVKYSAPSEGSVPSNRGIDDVYLEVLIGGTSTGIGYAQVAFGCDQFNDPNDPNNPNGNPKICLP